MSGGDEERGERPRRSWSEIDRMRDRPSQRSEEKRPRGPAAEARARAATQQYVKRLDTLFKPGPGGAEGERLERALRDAHGTPGLADACRAYRDAVGLPDDVSLLSLFLDARDPELVRAALEALRSQQAEGRLAVGAGLRSQLRGLAQDPDDEVAEAAEALLE